MKKEDQRKRIAVMIANRIQEVLRESDELTELLEEARDDGYNVLLTVFSGIIVRRREGEDAPPLPIKFEFTDFDKDFLHSIGIQVPVENA